MYRCGILEHELVKPHKWTVFTLAPERECLWNLGVSYVYDDLRAMPFKGVWFDAVFCVSVIEHVGMDNRLYATDSSYRQSSPRDHLLAIDEIKRVLRPNGRLFLTVPFGAHEDHGSLQQFDSAMLSTLASRFGPQAATKSFFRYTSRGWKSATEPECEDLSYFDVHAGKFLKAEIREYDVAVGVAARAVACIELQK